MAAAWAAWAAWAVWTCKEAVNWLTGELVCWPEPERQKSYAESPAQAGLSFLREGLLQEDFVGQDGVG
jgi:hypothetical protein